MDAELEQDVGRIWERVERIYAIESSKSLIQQRVMMIWHKSLMH